MRFLLPILSSLSIFWTLPSLADSNIDARFDRSWNSPHEVQLFDDNTAAFEARMQLIENATSFIYVETFSWKTDDVGRAFAQALIERKKQVPTIEILILIDWTPGGPPLTAFMAQKLCEKGIQVRFYNRMSVINFSSANHRNHRKLFQSENEAITGGRNIANFYFNLGETSNFIDRDVRVRGPVGESIQSSFLTFWKSAKVIETKAPERPVQRDFYIHDDMSAAPDLPKFQHAVDDWNQKTEEALNFLDSSKLSLKDKTLIEQLREAGKVAMAKEISFTVSKIRFVSDHPDWEDADAAVTGKAILSKLQGATEKVVIENGYILPDSDSFQIYSGLIQKKISLFFLTNSRDAARNEFAANALTLDSGIELVKMGAKFYLYNGKKMPNYENSSPERNENSAYATHAKTMVIDNRICAIGTCNFSPRSLRRMNSETALIFDDASFCSYVESAIQERTRNASEMKADGMVEGQIDDRVKSFIERMTLFAVPLIQTLFKSYF